VTCYGKQGIYDIYKKIILDRKERYVQYLDGKIHVYEFEEMSKELLDRVTEKFDMDEDGCAATLEPSLLKEFLDTLSDKLVKELFEFMFTASQRIQRDREEADGWITITVDEYEEPIFKLLNGTTEKRRKYFVIQTGYGTDHERMRRGKDFEGFLERVEKAEGLIYIGNIPIPAYDSIVKEIKEKCKDRTLLDGIDCIFAIDEKDNCKNINSDIAARARKLEYCNIWDDCEIEVRGRYKLDSGEEVVVLKLEAEAG